METLEIFPLTEGAVASLLATRGGALPQGKREQCQRIATRWPFPGTVELWIPQEGAEGDRYVLATSINLSTSGIGIEIEEPLSVGQRIGIAFHEPEASFHGRAIVRHCSDVSPESHLVGLQFEFPPTA